MMKVIKIAGISLVIASFILLIAFFATLGQGSESIESAAGDAMHVPILTDTVLIWTYILFALTISIAVFVAAGNFIKSMILNPVAAIKGLVPILHFGGILLVSYLMGSSEKISIIGYEGTQNEGVWAQVTDMFIYTIYTLFVLIIVTIFGARIYTALK